MTENDKKYRQGRSESQMESNYKVMGWAVYGLGITLIGIIIFSLFNG